MKLTDESIMPFGIHCDKKMEDVPAEYLLWLRDDMIDKGGPTRDQAKAVMVYVEENWQALTKEASDYDPKHGISR